MITRGNYEIWMLDYAEGRLNPAQQKLFLAFLEQNPDLKNELEAFEQVSLNKEPEEKPFSLNLHKKQSWLLEKYSADELVFHYNEGNLNAEEQREWKELVKSRPDLAEQARKEKQLTLKPIASEKFSEKTLLKRSEGVYELNAENYQHYFIQYYETRELALHMAIQAFLGKHPHLTAEFEQYGQTVLKADVSIVYEQKQRLKKKEKVVALYWWRYAAAAASVVLAIWLFYPNENTPVITASTETNGNDSLKEQGLPKNDVSPNHVIAQDNKVNEPVSNEKKIEEPGLANNPKQQENKKQGPKGIEHHKGQQIKEEQQPENNMANQHQPKEHPGNYSNKKDSVTVPVNKVEKEQLPVAENKKANGSSNIQTVEGPIQLVSKVFNDKYYEKETPPQQAASSFYAMRNVVHSVSGGQADVQKKEDKNYKEFSLKIGNFGFSRKKHKSE